MLRNWLDSLAHSYTHSHPAVFTSASRLTHGEIHRAAMMLHSEHDCAHAVFVPSLADMGAGPSGALQFSTDASNSRPVI